jgi:hypothetical protein
MPIIVAITKRKVRLRFFIELGYRFFENTTRKLWDVSGLDTEALHIVTVKNGK